MRTTLLGLIVFLLIERSLFAQTSTFFYPVSGESAALSSIETHDGRVALAGWHDTSESGRQALLVLLPGKKDQPMLHYAFGGGYNDAAHALIELPDGNFLLAGYAGQKSRQSAYLLRISREGEVLWQWEDPDPLHQSAFYDLISLGNGDVIAVGEKNSRAYAIAIQPVKGAEPLEWSLPDYPQSVARAAVLGLAGKIALTGRAGKADEPDIFLAELDAQLKMQGKLRRYTATGGAYGADVVCDPEGRRYIVALGNGQKQENTKAQLLYTTQTTLQAFDPFEEQRFKNTAETVLSLPGTQWLLAGATNQRGDQFGKFRPVGIKSNLKPGKKEKNLPMPRTPEGYIHHATLLHDGHCLLAGSAQNPDASPANRAFAFGLAGDKLPASTQNLVVSAVRFQEANGNDTLNAGEAAYLEFKVKKAGNKPLWGLRARVQVSGNSWGLRYVKTVYLGHLLRDTSTVVLSIPLAGETYLASGHTTIMVTLLDAAGIPLAAPFKDTFTTKEDPPPNLIIRFITRDSVLVPREEDVPVRVCVRNVGKGIARNVGLRINPPYLVQLRNKPFGTLDTLLPGDSVCYEARLKVSYLYPEEYFTVQAKASETRNYYVSVAYEKLTLRISSFYEVTPPEREEPVRLKGIEQKMRKGGPMTTLPKPEIYDKDGFEIRYSFLPVTKADDHLRDSLKNKTIRFHEPEFMLRAWIWDKSGQAYDTAFFRKHIKLYKTDTKGKEQIVDFFTVSRFEDTLFNGKHYIFFKKTYLEKGSNAFRLRVMVNGKEMGKSGVFSVEYRPPKIHQMYFGIPDLRNTNERLIAPPRNAAVLERVLAKAVDETRMLYLQAGTIVMDTTEEGTTRIKLYDYFSTILNDSTIQPEDHLVLVISGHGKIAKGKFELECSDGVLNERYAFGKNMLHELTAPNLRKVYIFLDACNSGNQNSPDTTGFQPDHDRVLIANPGRFYLFPSTGPEQDAYELDSLSLFTTALVEAFENKFIDDKGEIFCPDQDKDSVLTVAELSAFIRRRIPMLLDEYRTRLLGEGRIQKNKIESMKQNYAFPEAYFKDETPLIRFKK